MKAKSKVPFGNHFLKIYGATLYGTKIELVPLEAKLASAVESEAKEKECDDVFYANVSHKKGGGFD